MAGHMALFLVRVATGTAWAACLSPCEDCSRTKLSSERDGKMQARALSFKPHVAAAMLKRMSPG